MTLSLLLRGTLASALCLILATGCQPEATKTMAELPTIRRTAIDAAGRRVVLPHSARRVVALSAGAAEALVALGAADRLVAVPEELTDDYWAWPLPAGLARLVTRPALVVAGIQGLQPDLLVADVGTYPATALEQVAAQLELQLFYTPGTSSAIDHTALHELGSLLALEARGDSLQQQLRGYTASLSALTSGEIAYATAVLVEPTQEGEALGCIGQNHRLSTTIRTAGGRLVGERLLAAAPANVDSLLAWQPEWILLAGASDAFFLEWLASDRRLQSLPAIRQEQVILMPREQLLHTGPSSVGLAGVLAKVLHPRLQVPPLVGPPAVK
jgi:iron complex transport system substrate-binding protein